MKSIFTFAAACARATLVAQRTRLGLRRPSRVHAAAVYGFYLTIASLVAVPCAVVFLIGLPVVVLAVIGQRLASRFRRVKA